MQFQRNPDDALIAAMRALHEGVERALSVLGIDDADRADLLRIRRAAAQVARRPLLAEVAAGDSDQAKVFARTWESIVRACEEGLADPAYPGDRRPALYNLLGAARECAEPDALDRIRR